MYMMNDKVLILVARPVVATFFFPELKKSCFFLSGQALTPPPLSATKKRPIFASKQDMNFLYTKIKSCFQFSVKIY